MQSRLRQFLNTPSSLFILLRSGTSLRLTSSHEQKRVIIRPIGTDVTLDCKFVDDDNDDLTSSTIAWYYSNTPISSNDDTMVLENGNLVLKDVQLKDMGWYTCAASSTTERYELDFLLVVGGNLEFVIRYA